MRYPSSAGIGYAFQLVETGMESINWLKWAALKQEKREIKLWVEEEVVPKGKFQPRREKYLYHVFEVATRRGIKWG